MQNFQALGLRPQTSMSPAAVGLLPNLHPPAAKGLAPGHPMAFGGSAPRLPKQPLPPLRILATNV